MQDVPHRPQQVQGSDDQTGPGGGRGEPGRGGQVAFPCAEKNHDFADEVGEAGEAAAGQHGHDQGRADERQALQEAAQASHVEGPGLLIQVAAQSESQRREQSVRDHHEHGAGHADQAQARDAEKYESHVRHARIAEEEVEVFLAHRNQAAVEEVAQCEEREEVQPRFRAIRDQRQRDADEAQQTEFFQDAGMEHRGCRRGGTVAQRRPGMKGPERHEDAEAEHQQGEDETLGPRRHGIGPEITRDFAKVECAPVGRQLHVERNQANQGDQRAQAEVKRDLESRVVSIFAAAPDADHDEGRHQRQFMEKVEEKQIDRGERAQDAAGHHQKQDVILLFALLDFPGNAGGGEGDDGAHQNQAHVDAVHAEPTVNAKSVGAEQRNRREELIIFGSGVEPPEQPDSQQRHEEGGRQCRESHQEAIVARHKSQAQRREQRQENECGQHRIRSGSTMNRNGRRPALSSDHKIEQPRDTQHEQEGVGLQVAVLRQPQGPAE